jgi:dolichol-phosphate mannosyltransferase
MYEDAPAAWRGWTRSLPMRDRYFGLRSSLGLAEIFAAQALPLPLLLLGGLLTAPGWFVGVQAALFTMRLGVLVGTARTYEAPPTTYWLSPLADAVVVLRILWCTVRRRHAWRGRVYVRRRDGGFQLDASHRDAARGNGGL